MAGDLPLRRSSTAPPSANPESAANHGNQAGTSHVNQRQGKEHAVPGHSVDSRLYAEQSRQLTEAEQEVLRLNRLLAERERQLEEARTRRGPGRPPRRNETETARTETVHTVGRTHTGPVTRQTTRNAGVATGTNAQVPQEQRRPPSPVRFPPSPIRHPEPVRNEQVPPADNHQGSQSNRTSNQGDNNSRGRRTVSRNRRATPQAQPRQEQAHQEYRHPEHHRHRENSYREASVGSSRSASSRSGRRTRSFRPEPDLRDHLNQNRGFEPQQPDLRERINEQRGAGRPAGYPPVIPEAVPYVPMAPVVAAVDPNHPTIMALQAQINALIKSADN